MSEDTEPRRWEVVDGASYVLALGGVRPNRGERVHVREDTVTEADVEAVANWLARFADEVEFNTTEGRDRLSDARSLLSTIFKD